MTRYPGLDNMRGAEIRPKISETKLNIDLEQLNRLASREINFELIDRFFCALKSLLWSD